MIKVDSKTAYKKNLRIALIAATLFGLATILVVLLFNASGNPMIYSIAVGFSYTGNDVFLLTSNALIIGWAWRKRLRSVIKLILWMNFFVWFSVHLIKLVPFGEWALRPGDLPGGFPSGHATHAFVMAFALTSCFPRFWWLWNLIAAVISWSRVEVGDHTGFQVTVGVCFGILIAWAFTSRWIKLEESN
ncbi:hypothetical protein AXX12_10845 [Anaerosporomusa subterranea]|uniref:Phosphatidic acid phosphatase type 2/haloperoxidase domain-containing protein n=1 Tax=Anaerosporomusa subterranea TaxID=1794912 RepID=A0A154BP66_ANASB|nr:phosphatase PAP2 family protein [Anaerosporomusa subterranea]KYZ75701.1 hypothetical protein AXX12_10845 [Anaerosporomusa subterranea]